MIYLIGGSPRCGKTTVAEKLARQTNIPWFPADYLGAAIFQYLSEEQQDDMFPISRVRSEKPGTDYLYSKHSPEEVVNFYRTQAEAIWPGLSAFIKYAAQDEQSFILEGYQIWPDLLTELSDETKESIKPIFLHKENLAEIEAGFKKSSNNGDWLLANTKEEPTFSKVASMVALYGKRTVKEAEKHKMPVVNMDGDFQEKINEALNYLNPNT